jgi:SAM-dependent methyltransferase
MHDTAYISGECFFRTYGKENTTVVDIGGMNVNGSLRSIAESLNMKYISVDMTEHESVDIVLKDPHKLPFENQSVDLIISTSCFEHDPCFWITFKEMCRIIKNDGYIYINAPKNGVYHCYPGDNWRFYFDAGQALAYWSSYQYKDEDVFPVEIVETFHINPMNDGLNDGLNDFVCIWKRTEEKQKEILVKPEIYNNRGKLQTELNSRGLSTTVKF